MSGNPDLQRGLGNIEELLHKIESTADPSLRASVQELVELVMSLHGAGLERMIELVRATGDPGDVVMQKLAADELTASLLVLYGLHPQKLEVRVMQALDKVRSRGAEAELVSVQDGAVRVRLTVKAHGCGSTAQSVREIVETAVYQAAPDLTALTIESAEERQGFVPLEMLVGSQPVPAGKGGL